MRDPNIFIIWHCTRKKKVLISWHLKHENGDRVSIIKFMAKYIFGSGSCIELTNLRHLYIYVR